MIKPLLIFAALIALAAGNSNIPASTAAGIPATGGAGTKTYKVDTGASVLGWQCSKVVVGTHNGTVNISNGEIGVKNGELVHGTFIMDMNTITNLDLDAEYKPKLEGHLKSPDFFNVDSFPTAMLQFTKVVPIKTDSGGYTHYISGNLTLKSVVRQIIFPARVIITKKTLTATAQTKINRAEWGITWGNKADAGTRMFLKENFISNTILLTINITAKR
jgi:polyisoprenoid-binding protein YceI